MSNEPKGDLTTFAEAVRMAAHEVEKAARTEVQDHPVVVAAFVVLAVAALLALSLLM